MADFKYTYPLSDFPNNKYNLDTLGEEVRDASLSSTLNYIDGYDESVDLFFLTALTGSDPSTLYTVIVNHQGDQAADAEYIYITPKDISIDPSINLAVAAVDPSGLIVSDPNAILNYYGQNFQLDASTSLTTTSSTSPLTKVTMVTEDLPAGLYKITAGWMGSYTNDKNEAVFDATLNGTPLGVRTDVQYTGPKDGNTIMVFDRRFYENLSGVNTIALRYWSNNGLYSTSISDAYIELIRIH